MSETQQYKLKAMAKNYAGGHRWDHLDSDTCSKAAEEIGTLLTANQRLEGLLQRVQVSMSLDDTEWGYSGTEKYTLLADIRAALSTANGEVTK